MTVPFPEPTVPAASRAEVFNRYLDYFRGQLAFKLSALDPGDIILYNFPYGTGSHPQDMAVVMPVFLPGGDLVGYTTIKGHLLDIGGKEPYSTDTVDVFLPQFVIQ